MRRSPGLPSIKDFLRRPSLKQHEKRIPLLKVVWSFARQNLSPPSPGFPDLGPPYTVTFMECRGLAPLSVYLVGYLFPADYCDRARFRFLLFFRSPPRLPCFRRAFFFGSPWSAVLTVRTAATSAY